jgi:hypothetical protein
MEVCEAGTTGSLDIEWISSVLTVRWRKGDNKESEGNGIGYACVECQRSQQRISQSEVEGLRRKDLREIEMWYDW